MTAQDDGGIARPPKIYDVVPLPDSERGRECTLWTGDGPTPCGNEATHLFVYEVSLDADDDNRGNCLCCAECKPEAAHKEPLTDGGQDADGVDRLWKCPDCGNTKNRHHRAETRPFCGPCEDRHGVLIEMRPVGDGKEKFAEHGGDL